MKIYLTGLLGIGLLLLLGNSYSHAGTLISAYEFNNSFQDILLDGQHDNALVPGTHSSNPGVGTFSNGHYLFGPDQGVTLSNGMPDGGSYSVELLFSFSQTESTKNYRSIMDPGSRTDDHLYARSNGALHFYNGTISAGGVVTPDVLAHLVFSRSSDGSFQVYVDGNLVLSDNRGSSSFASSGVLHFFEDQSCCQGESSSGMVDYIRIYDGTLSQQEVGDLFSNRNVALNPVPEASSFFLVALALLVLGKTRRNFWAK